MTTGQELVDTAVLSERGHAYIRFRLPVWADQQDYMRLSVIEVNGRRSRGPWAHLFARRTQEAIEEPPPQAMMTIPGLSVFNVAAFLAGHVEPWNGPLDEADKD